MKPTPNKIAKYAAACASSLDPDTVLVKTDGYVEGYTDGYANALEIERVPSDGMITRILALSNTYDRICDEQWSLNKRVDFIRENLYNNAEV